uniref:Diguanylate cyclase/phosphodiesterase n=1 Tax=Rhodopseudomonas palustris (strain BisA53) TaxID=316055 RepID=Q07NT5_RHOP5
MSSATKAIKTIALTRAQAASSLENNWLTVVSNIIIAISLALLLHFEDNGTLIFGWLGGVVVFGVFRAFLTFRLQSKGEAERDPQNVLRILAAMALASGVLWSVVPLWFDAFSSTRNIEYLAFIVAGTTTGAIIQSLAYAPIAIAFATPLLATTIYCLLLTGSTSATIMAVDAAFLALMLLRATILGERRFIDGQIKATEAIELANSLTEANREIVDSNLFLERIARTDPLTGLANRSHFQDISQSACRSGKGLAFVLIDIDNFKTINDSRGHSVGDGVIRSVANLLRSACNEHDVAVRLGGDEFVVILQGQDTSARAVTLAERLSTAMRMPINVAGNALFTSCSIGIAAQEDGEIDVDDLLARADVALYRAKDEGRACIRVFDAKMQSELDLQRCIDIDLPGAFDRKELHLEFQPQVVLSTGEVIGFEALLRWKHPRMGMIPPPDIVNAAIRIRQANLLTRFVAEEACVFISALDDRQLPKVKVAINVSPREFSMHSPARILKELTSRYSIDPKRIEIEVTEEALFDPKHCATELQLIDEYGFGLAIDDFGVGHSSISNLMAVAIDTVKIDRSFVSGIGVNLQHQQLVAAITAVSMPLGQRIIAEGVETEEDLQTLRMLGCSYGQGWLFGRPMPSNEAIDWLARKRSELDNPKPASARELALLAGT